MLLRPGRQWRCVRNAGTRYPIGVRAADRSAARQLRADPECLDPHRASVRAERLLRMFELEGDPRFLLLQRSFVLFDQTDLFPHFRPLAHEERRWRASPESSGPGQVFADDLSHDREQYAMFARAAAPSRFTALTLDRQREYFDLWRRSRFLLRRAFYATSRSLVLITAYSMDEVWPAIGYAGPLLPRPATRS